MNTLHIGNAFFEWEIEKTHCPTIYEAFTAHRNFLYLQFLPLIYAPVEDTILVTEEPSSKQRRFSTIDKNQTFFTHIQSFAASESVKRFAILHNLIYEIPPLEVVKEIANKEFCFYHSSPLPGSKVIKTKEDLDLFSKQGKGKKVLKTPFGFAGRGHHFLDSLKTTENFSQMSKASKKNPLTFPLPLIGEPWVERDFDFSSHWFIEKESKSIRFLGFTQITCSSKGGFISATPLSILPTDKSGSFFHSQQKNLPKDLDTHLKAHLDIAYRLLEKIRDLGFFGEISFDAFIYNKDTLHPIVEINPRKTLGKIALEVQQTLLIRKNPDFSRNKDTINPPNKKIHRPLPTELSGVKFPIEIVTF